MEHSEPKKLALLYLLEILKSDTDARHPLRQEALAATLADRYGVFLERKAIARNLALLEEAGYDIAKTSEGYYLRERLFEPSELRLLIDSVLCSRHISPRHSRELAERLAAEGGKHFRARCRNIATAAAWDKTEACELFYNIEVADDAIEAGHRLAFSYCRFGPDKRLRPSSHHTVSPYRMLLKNQHYYLMAYSDTYEKIAYFRMDKITAIEELTAAAVPLRSIPGYENGIDEHRLSSALPYMYGDLPVPVVFSATAGILDQVVDWFGTDAEIAPLSEGDYRVTVRVSPAAMEYWAMQYAKYVRILSPTDLRDRVVENLRAALQSYTAEKSEK